MTSRSRHHRSSLGFYQAAGLAGLAVLLVVVGAHGISRFRSSGHPTASGTPTPAAPAGTASAPAAGPGAAQGERVSVGFGAAPRPAGSASPSPRVPPGERTVEWYLAHLPTFDPAPTPQRVSLDQSAGAPVLHQVPTGQKVAFITIDDGFTRHPDALALLRASGVPVSLFLISREAEKGPEYFRSLQRAGATVQNHTISHTSLRGLTYQRQKKEICGAADRLGQLFGERPELLRPPYGEYDEVTQRAAKDCGMRAVVHWRETVDKGKMRYQTPTKKVFPGDIILMHFRPAYAADFYTALKRIHDSGLTPALLDDYLLGGDPPPETYGPPRVTEPAATRQDAGR